MMKGSYHRGVLLIFQHLPTIQQFFQERALVLRCPLLFMGEAATLFFIVESGGFGGFFLITCFFQCSRGGNFQKVSNVHPELFNL